MNEEYPRNYYAGNELFLCLSCTTIMTPHLLRTFVAVCRHRSITRAADVLFLTQPAVSRQIQQLERDLGVPLFDRMGKSLHLTRAGEKLAEEAGRILGQLERAAEVVRGCQAVGAGRVRIGASTTPGYYLLPEILGRYHRRFPDVELHYVVANSLSIEERIMRNELDIGVVGGHLARQDLLMVHVADDRIVCFCGVRHPLARARSVNLAALGGETWVVREKGSATRALFEQWLETEGGSMPRTIELNSPEGIKALVAAGVGVSFLSIHAIDKEHRRRRLRLLPVPAMKLSRPIYIVMHPDKHLSPDLKMMCTMIRDDLSPVGK